MDPQHVAAFKRVRTSEYLTVEENYKQLDKFITDYEAVKSSLSLLSEKCRHPVMVPFGSVAFMSGTLVHTNDVLVLLGDNWFVEQSAKQTTDILNRRVAALQTEAEKLQARMQQIKTELNYAQGLANESSDTFEIVEPYDEQAEQCWKTKHEASVKKYRQEMKLSSTANAVDGASSERMEYEQILCRLEQLEMEEESNNVNEDENERYPAAELGVQEAVSDPDDDSDNTGEGSQSVVINFKHSLSGSQIRERGSAILSPADIYDKFFVQSSSLTSQIIATDLHQFDRTEQSQMSSEPPDSQSHVIVSHDSEMPQSSLATDIRSSAPEPTVRKVSKFKASRLMK